jgi:hypothetical protein
MNLGNRRICKYIRLRIRNVYRSIWSIYSFVSQIITDLVSIAKLSMLLTLIPLSITIILIRRLNRYFFPVDLIPKKLIVLTTALSPSGEKLKAIIKSQGHDFTECKSLSLLKFDICLIICF